MLLPLLFAISSSAHAWKLETHYWLAKEVLKELDASSEGFVTIPSRPSARMPMALKQAIQTKRGDYFLGVLGPDIYPDMVAGQMTVHPGLEPTSDNSREILPQAKTLLSLVGRQLSGPLWMTDDWMKFVRDRAIAAPPATPASIKNRQLAFAYGYLTHAAMDMWAHSYVNVYSGDVFSMTDEQEVEFRHMAIETLVKQTHRSIFTDPQPLSQEEAASELRRRLNAPSTLTQGVADELSKVSAPVDFVRRTLVLHPEAANQYAREQTTLHLFAMYMYWAEVGAIRDRLQPLRNTVKTAAENAGKAVNETKAALKAFDSAANSAAEAVSNANSRLEAEKNKLLNEIEKIARQFGLNVNVATWPKPARDLIAAFESAVNNAERQLDAAKKWSTAEAVHNAINQVRDHSLDLLDGGVTAWQEGIEDAVDAYLLAWEDTGKELMRPPGTRFSPGGDVTAPLKHWVTCWGPTFGLPGAAQLAPACHKAMQSYMNAANTIKMLLQHTLIPKPMRDAIENMDALMARAVQQVVPQVAQLVSNTIRIDNGAIAGYARSIVNLRSKEPTLAEIDADFADDISQKQLMVFPSKFTNLLYQDMGLAIPASGQGHNNKSLTDLKDFAALQNAFTMAKLVLLDGAALNRLTLPPPSGTKMPGSPLLTATPATPYNLNAFAGEILIGAVRSIDGDHQWQKFAPKLPRRASISCTTQWPKGSDRANYCASRKFGYDASDPGKGGLKFWHDPQLRQSVFNQIFQGPLNPGLLSAVGLANLHTLAQGIGKCAADPFPPSSGIYIDPCRAPLTGVNPSSSVIQLQTQQIIQQGQTTAPATQGQLSQPKNMTIPAPRIAQ